MRVTKACVRLLRIRTCVEQVTQWPLSWVLHGSPYPLLEGPRQSVGVRIANSRGNAKARESVSPTRGATPKRGSSYPQLKGPHQSVGVRIPNSRGHAKAWKSVSPTRGAMPKRGKERQKDERKNAVAAQNPLKNLALHLGWGFAPNAGSSLRNKRHLYSASSC